MTMSCVTLACLTSSSDSSTYRDGGREEKERETECDLYHNVTLSIDKFSFTFFWQNVENIDHIHSFIFCEFIPSQRYQIGKDYISTTSGPIFSRVRFRRMVKGRQTRMTSALAHALLAGRSRGYADMRRTRPLTKYNPPLTRFFLKVATRRSLNDLSSTNATKQSMKQHTLFSRTFYLLFQFQKVCQTFPCMSAGGPLHRGHLCPCSWPSQASCWHVHSWPNSLSGDKEDPG